MKYRLQTWTGPTQVHEIADKLRDAGFEVICEGTERVYFDFDSIDEEQAVKVTLNILLKAYGTTFGLRPQVVTQ